MDNNKRRNICFSEERVAQGKGGKILNIENTSIVFSGITKKVIVIGLGERSSNPAIT